MAQVGDCFRRTLGSDDVAVACARLPRLRHRQQLRSKRVAMRQCPVGVQVFGVGEEALAEFMEGPLHRVERVRSAGKNCELQ